jgi:hypothetical protein
MTIFTKDLKDVKITINANNLSFYNTFHESTLQYNFYDFALKYAKKFNKTDRDGWKIYNFEKEFERQQVDFNKQVYFILTCREVGLSSTKMKISHYVQAIRLSSFFQIFLRRILLAAPAFERRIDYPCFPGNIIKIDVVSGGPRRPKAGSHSNETRAMSSC